MRRLLIALGCAVAIHLAVVQLPWYSGEVVRPTLPSDRSIQVQFAGQTKKKEETRQNEPPVVKTITQPATKKDLKKKAKKQSRPKIKQPVLKPIKKTPKKNKEQSRPFKVPKTSVKRIHKEPGSKDPAKQLSHQDPPHPVSAPEPESTIVKAVPIYHRNPKPEYPSLSRKRSQQGTVILEVKVRQDGSVADVSLSKSSGFGLLDKSAMKTVYRWKFIPGSHNGRPVGMKVLVPIQFVLQ